MNIEVNRELRELSIKVLMLVADGAHLLRHELEPKVASVGFLENKNHENFQIVTEGLKELGILNIMLTSSNEDVFFITKEWEKVIANKNVIKLLSSVPWIIPNKIIPNWDKAFDDLMEIERSFVTNSKRNKVLIDDNIPRIKSVIDSLNDKQKYNFYVSLQDQMEQEALKGIENK